MSVDSRELLTQGMAKLGLDPDEKQVSHFLAYINLLQKWNKTFNLTTVDTTSGIITQHLLDSLAIIPYIRVESIVDVGSGAGLPGIPLAIMLPDIRVTMLDSNGKKTRFLNQVILELGLENAEAVQSRVEQFRPDIAPEMIVTRAFAPLQRMVKSCAHLMHQGVPLLAMKSARVDHELEDWPHQGWDIKIDELTVPGITAKRYAVLINERL